MLEIPDDMVRVKSRRPPHEFPVACTIRLTGGGDLKKHPLKAAVKVTLKNPDRRLLFLKDDLTLPANGEPAEDFFISGEAVSENVGDAKIEVIGTGAADGLVAEKYITVFGFAAQISVTPGGNYGVTGDKYGPDDGKTVSFSATATLIPVGVDCSAPQIKKTARWDCAGEEAIRCENELGRAHG